ncbi:shikimate dehydrogenase [uncultured Kriegella sp.]|uniref:shikimate dehydrogenase family protein n=1 Tax=uncultured Kriegella sp. TaxID=1798910 RepID=UPI0030DAD441|tara:strand:- start:131791 stop:132546 length:756 start_codon:yes stop_codon:yes gene_type:complete
MENAENKRVRFGLVGRDISYSFSKGYFTKKFNDLALNDHSYENFDLPKIEEFEQLIKTNTDIKGFNVTIPYKQAVMPYLAKLDEKAQKIGAVNTIKVTSNGLKGYNTDAYGFQKSLEPLLKQHHQKALILGTGGASKAIAFVLGELGISHTFVSRNPDQDQLSYKELSKKVILAHTVIINCTPLGTHPNVKVKPSIPYEHLTSNHLLYDLIYNPSKTAFLAAGESQGASIGNGQRMLEYQAEKAWEIWCKE